MGFRVFWVKYVFFEEFDDGVNTKHRPDKGQQKNKDPPAGKKLIQQEVFWYDQQDNK